MGLILSAALAGCSQQHAGEQMTNNAADGFRVCTLDHDGTAYRYAVYVPPEYDPSRSWPAILFLHGAGERGEDGVRHTTVGLGRAIREYPKRFPCIVIMPHCPPDMRWEGPMQRLALATLAEQMSALSIDPDAVVLTGLSLGGYGTWSIGAKHPQRFSALVPICGGGEPADAAALARVPIWCFHGDADPVVPVERSREMVEAVQAAGGQIKYTELAGVTHNSWDPAYGDAAVIEWMLAQRRTGR